MKRYWNLCCVLLVLFLLSGCGGMFGDGRMEAWKNARVAEEETKQELLKTKQAEMAAKKEKAAEQNPTLKVTTLDSAGNPVVVEMDLAPAIEAAVGKKADTDTYGVDVVTTPMPEGEFAEGAKATGNAVTKVAGSPAVLIGTSGYMMREVLVATGGGGTEITAETANISEAFNTNELHATGEGNSTSMATAEPTVVDPVVVGGE